MDESTYFVTTLEAQYSEDGPQYVVKVPVGLVERLKLTEGSSVYLEVVAKE